MNREERDVIDAAKDFILYLTMLDAGYTITVETQEQAKQVCDRLNRLQANVEVIANEVCKPSIDYEKGAPCWKKHWMQSLFRKPNDCGTCRSCARARCGSARTNGVKWYGQNLWKF